MTEDTEKKARTPHAVKVDPMHPEGSYGKRHKVLGEIAEGGMGVVLESADLNLLRRTAIKQVKSDLRRYNRPNHDLIVEAQITAQLDHPNIVPVHDLGRDEAGALYFSMKHVDGDTLSELLKQLGRTARSADDLFRFLQIFIKVCDAVAFAHSRGVIHRDIKPDNIMIGDYGEVCVMDWGLALLRDDASQRIRVEDELCDDRQRFKAVIPDRELVGTPEYMAPEQAREETDRIDGRTDVFSLGAVLCEILTGDSPYSGTLMQVVDKAREGKLDRSLDGPLEDLPFHLHPRLGRIAARALRFRRRDRHPSVLELKEEVEGFIQGGGRFDKRSFAARTPIVRQDEGGDEAYIITRGRCHAYKHVKGEKISLRHMGPGEVFGETSILTDQPRSASVEAVEPVDLMVVRRGDFEEELNSGVWPGSFLKALADRFMEKDAQVSALERTLRICAHVLIFLNLSGADADGSRWARWSGFRTELAARSNCTEGEIDDGVAHAGLFVIDEENDRIGLSEAARGFV